jgi:two-component system OmpR family sensor kinase
MTIRVRLTMWYALVVTITLIVLGGIVWLQYSDALRRSLDEVLRAQATATQELVEAVPPGSPDVGALERGVFLVVFDTSGRVSYASPGAPTFDRPIAGYSTLGVGTAARDELYAIAASNGKMVVAGSSVAGIDRSLESLVSSLAVVGIAGAIVLILGGWWLATRALRPVAELTRAADAIGTSDLGQRLAEPAQQDELGALARTLNRMLGRVEEAVGRQRAFVIGASHDLRTPLASLRTELELAMTGSPDRDDLLTAVGGAHADAVRLSELANGLLRLAAAEPDGRPMDTQTFPLGPFIGDCVALVAKAASGRDVAIEVDVPDLAIRADRTRLQQAIVNLLTNAIRSSPTGMTVEIRATVEVDQVPRLLRIQVLDRGPGVASDVRETLFEPFARSRMSRSPGSGLGLATAAAAIHAHGGAIGYEDREGGGARFWFWLPA